MKAPSFIVTFLGIGAAIYAAGYFAYGAAWSALWTSILGMLALAAVESSDERSFVPESISTAADLGVLVATYAPTATTTVTTPLPFVVALVVRVGWRAWVPLYSLWLRRRLVSELEQRGPIHVRFWIEVRR